MRPSALCKVFRRPVRLCLWLLLPLCLAVMPVRLLAQDAQATAAATVPPMQTDVARAFNDGKCAPLTPYFAGQVELRIPGKSGIFSRKQAEMIVASFLAETAGGIYLFDHEERSDDSAVSIASWKARGTQYRIQLLTTGEGDTTKIKQLKIEEVK